MRELSGYPENVREIRNNRVRRPEGYIGHFQGMVTVVSESNRDTAIQW